MEVFLRAVAAALTPALYKEDHGRLPGFLAVYIQQGSLPENPTIQRDAVPSMGVLAQRSVVPDSAPRSSASNPEAPKPEARLLSHLKAFPVQNAMLRDAYMASRDRWFNALCRTLGLEVPSSQDMRNMDRRILLKRRVCEGLRSRGVDFDALPAGAKAFLLEN